MLTFPSSGIAHEEGGRCGARVRRWTEKAAADIDLRLETVFCIGGMAKVRLFPEGAHPVDVEIAEPPGPAFARAGRLRVSPIIDVANYSALPPEQRRAFEDLLGWLRANEERIALIHASQSEESVLPAGIGWAGPWLVVIAFALVLAGCRWWPKDRGGDSLAALALFSGAVLVRSLLGLWGPFHINGQGPIWVRGALENPSLLAAYGPGYPELMSVVARLPFTDPDTSIFAANVAISSLVPVLIFAILRSTGVSRLWGLAAGMIACLDPLSVRVAASECYFPLAIALPLGASLAFLRAGRLLADRRWVGAGALFLGGALLATQAARAHPIAWIPAAFCPLAVMGLPRWPSRPVRWAAMAVGIALGSLLLILALSSGGVLHERLAHVVRDTVAADLMAGLRGSPPVKELLLALVVGGVATGLSKRPSLVAVATFHALALLATRDAYDQSPLWQASYDRIFAPWLVIGLVSALPLAKLTGWRGVATSLVVAATIPTATLVLHWTHLVSPTTEQLEYEVLSRELPLLSDDATVLYVARSGQRIVEIPDYLTEARTVAIDGPEGARAAVDEGRPTVFLWTSICSTAEARSLCDSVVEELDLQLEVRAALPASPSNFGLPYREDTVEVGIARERDQRRPFHLH